MAILACIRSREGAAPSLPRFRDAVVDDSAGEEIASLVATAQRRGYEIESKDKDGFEIFLVAVVLAGVIQLVMGALRAGALSYLFPSPVIRGMLAGIGIIIFIKQIPYALGLDKDRELATLVGVSPETIQNWRTGAVGELKLTREFSRTSVSGDESITLKIKISGTGNFNTISVPELVSPQGFDIYDPKFNEKINYTTSGVSGYKELEYLLVPQFKGDFIVPEMRWTYFNTKTGTYEELILTEETVEVLSGAEAPAGADVNGAVVKREVQDIDSDIRYLHPIEEPRGKRNGILIAGLLAAVVAGLWGMQGIRFGGKAPSKQVVWQREKKKVMAAFNSGMPSTWVYLVWPSWMARIAASFTCGGVSKSGSPTARPMTSRPAARRSSASDEIATVGEGAMRVTRSAKAMDGVSGPAPGPASGVFDESLMASDVPQGRDGGKGVCPSDHICCPAPFPRLAAPPIFQAWKTRPRHLTRQHPASRPPASPRPAHPPAMAHPSAR